jgi:hypothetical protein
LEYTFKYDEKINYKNKYSFFKTIKITGNYFNKGIDIIENNNYNAYDYKYTMLMKPMKNNSKLIYGGNENLCYFGFQRGDTLVFSQSSKSNYIAIIVAKLLPQNCI